MEERLLSAAARRLGDEIGVMQLDELPPVAELVEACTSVPEAAQAAAAEAAQAISAAAGAAAGSTDRLTPAAAKALLCAVVDRCALDGAGSLDTRDLAGLLADPLGLLAPATWWVIKP